MEPLSLSLKERRRLEVLSRIRHEGLSVAESEQLLGVSERQAWRLKRRYATGGDAGLGAEPRKPPEMPKMPDLRTRPLIRRMRCGCALKRHGIVFLFDDWPRFLYFGHRMMNRTRLSIHPECSIVANVRPMSSFRAEQRCRIEPLLRQSRSAIQLPYLE